MTETRKLELSASKIKTYKQCPRRYYYQYIEKLPRKEWDHFDLGTFVHGTLEFFHESFRDDSIKKNLRLLMKESFKKQREIMEQDKSLSKEILNEARDMLAAYLKDMEEKGIGSEILTLEEEFVLDLNDFCKVKGIVDRLDKDVDGVFHIKDYKTNKDTKYMEPEQLRIYGIYLLSKYPDVEKFRGSYIMLRFGGMLLPHDFNLESVEEEKENVIKCAETILEEERWISKPSKLCDWCDFKSVCFNSW